MKLKNGYIAMDSYGDWKYFKERPTLEAWSTVWSAKEDYNIPKAMFEDLPEGEWRNSLRQILNGKIIFPLPELEVDAKVFVREEKSHFSHWGDRGEMFYFLDGRTSWSAEGVESTFSWELPDGSQD
jgi:hypothetical protein